MRCNVEISAELVPLLLELRRLPEAVRLHIADILASRSDASTAGTNGEAQHSLPSARIFLMIDEVECGDLNDLKKWIESLEDEFEPMLQLGVADEELEDSYITVLGEKISDAQDRELRPNVGLTVDGTALDILYANGSCYWRRDRELSSIRIRRIP
jgi:hypothetical protein